MPQHPDPQFWWSSIGGRGKNVCAVSKFICKIWPVAAAEQQQ